MFKLCGFLKFPNERISQNIFSADDSPPGDADEPVAEKEMSISREEKATGTVAFRVYKTYWLAIGACLALTILSFVVLMQGQSINTHCDVIKGCDFVIHHQFITGITSEILS